MSIWIRRQPVKVDTDTFFGSAAERVPVWSPDSKWLAYSKSLRNQMRAIHVYSLDQSQVSQMTDGMSDASYPVFDKDGKYLYFTASTDVGPALEQDLT